MEKSAGLILFREKKGKREYLLLKYFNKGDPDKRDYWGLVKGHLEPPETEEQSALRETKEETNLEKIKLIPDFKEKIDYFFKREGKTIYREVVFFLGKVLDETDGHVSEEHQELRWLPYEETVKLIKYTNDRSVVLKAEKKLNSL